MRYVVLSWFIQLFGCQHSVSDKDLASLIFDIAQNGAGTIYSFCSIPSLPTAFSGSLFPHFRNVLARLLHDAPSTRLRLVPLFDQVFLAQRGIVLPKHLAFPNFSRGKKSSSASGGRSRGFSPWFSERLCQQPGVSPYSSCENVPIACLIFVREVCAVASETTLYISTRLQRNGLYA